MIRSLGRLANFGNKMIFGLTLFLTVVVEAQAEQKLYFVHSDHLGTPQLLTDENQTVVWQAEYTPFGEATVDEDPDGDGVNIEFNLRLPGQYYDKETGTAYNIYRTYDARTGRYEQSDPIGLQGGINTYGYVFQNPLKYIDPFGLDVTIVINRSGSTQNSVSGTINVTSNVTSQSFSGHTLESANPPNSNLPVPPGSYSAFVRTDHTPNRVELNNVPNATNIQIHNGNTAADVVGCFAVGTTASTDFVGNSISAMSQINSIIQADGSGNITVVVNGNP